MEKKNNMNLLVCIIPSVGEDILLLLGGHVRPPGDIEAARNRFYNLNHRGGGS